MIKKYIVASVCVLAYCHLLPLALQKGPSNSVFWDLFVILACTPFLVGAIIASLIIPGVLHGAPMGMIGAIANDIFYIGIIWTVCYFKNRKAETSAKV